MPKNYAQTIELINHAISTMGYDYSQECNDAKVYLSMALGSLMKASNKQDKKNSHLLAARKLAEEKGKQKMEEWNAKVKENLEKLKLE